MFCFIFTEITSVLDIFMDWFFMSLQNSLCCSFIFTQITWIYSTFAWTDSIWVFRCPCFKIMSKKIPGVWTVPVRRCEMVHQIRPGNQSAFAFMTRINSTTPKLSITSCSTPDFSPYVAAVKILIFHITLHFVIKNS